jgi:RNA polymerase sigma factor (TIGR02999 family)
MASGPGADVTQLLVSWSQGDRAALEQLLPLVYGELRRLASSYLRRERPNHTLQSTALVHEAFLRLVNQRDVQWSSRAHFYAIAAQLIRRILVDYARSQHTEKRGAGAIKLELDEAMAVPLESGLDLDLLTLNGALDQLARLDARQSQIVELRFFAGLSIEETAEVMKLSPASIKREWSTARAWLFREVTRKQTLRDPDV